MRILPVGTMTNYMQKDRTMPKNEIPVIGTPAIKQDTNDGELLFLIILRASIYLLSDKGNELVSGHSSKVTLLT